MEGAGGSGSVQAAASVVKKRRSSSVRRPRQGSPLHFGSRDPSPLSSTPSSDNANKFSPDDSSGYDGSSRRKEIYLNYSPPKVASLSKFDDAGPSRKKKKDDRAHGEFDAHYASIGLRDHGRNGSDVKRSSEGVLAPSNWKGSSKFKENSETHSLSPEQYGHNLHQSAGSSSVSVESKLKKVKLKVGGVTRTIPAKSNIETDNIGSSIIKYSRSSDASRHRSKKKRAQNKGNRTSDSAGFGTSLHTGGSIPHAEHRRRLEKSLRRQPTILEVHTRTHQKQETQEWITPKAQKAYEDYIQLSHSQGSAEEGASSTASCRRSDYELWTEAVDGVQKGRIYGLGS